MGMRGAGKHTSSQVIQRACVMTGTYQHSLPGAGYVLEQDMLTRQSRKNTVSDGFSISKRGSLSSSVTSRFNFS